jgi:hypothetical protein
MSNSEPTSGYPPIIMMMYRRVRNRAEARFCTEGLAQIAIVEAIRLNEQEAPQREIERQNKQDEEKRAAGQKARPANKAGFRP